MTLSSSSLKEIIQAAQKALNGRALPLGELDELLSDLADLLPSPVVLAMAEEILRLREAQQPDMLWLDDNPEMGGGSLADLVDMFDIDPSEYQEPTKLMCAKSLPARWLAFFHNAEDDDWEPRDFTTEEEADEALRVAALPPSHGEGI